MQSTLRYDDPSPSAREMLKEYPPLLQELLYHRGITTKEAAHSFLSPDYMRDVHDPFLFRGMEKAVVRIQKAVADGERIIIYSDYDCDGGPGGVILHDFFKKAGVTNFRNYIPHRHEEGYGLHVEAVEEFAKEDARLIITVDCGISDNDAVTRAVELGIDVIIADHHEPPAVLPSAYVILNPKCSEETYPTEDICGCGVAFKLIQALVIRGTPGVPPGFEKWFLDMVALATLSDMVPLRGENRAFAHYGLLVMRKSRRVGLRALLSRAKVPQRYLTEDDVGYMLAPRINAASRMGVSMDAFKLLTTGDEEEAIVLAKHLEHINDERKGVVAAMVKEMHKRVASLSELRSVIVMGNPLWRPSLLGLAANTLVKSYERPVFLWGREGRQIIKGSCRSDGSVSVVEMMTYSRELFIDFGGHAFSGGFSVVEDSVHHLENGLIGAYERVRANGVSTPDPLIDGALALSDVSKQTYRLIASLAPFGEGNPRPVFLFENVEVASVKRFGKKQEHLALTLTDGGVKVPAIIFFFEGDDSTLTLGAQISFTGSIEESRFRGFPEIRLRIAEFC